MNKILNYFEGKINSLSDLVSGAVNMLQNKDIFVVLLIILVGFGGFGLGRLSKTAELKEPIVIEEVGQEATVVNAQKQKQQVTTEQGKYVASKNGTKYYLPWCSGVDRISEANKIWFQTKEEAEARGLQPAANCSGI